MHNVFMHMFFINLIPLSDSLIQVVYLGEIKVIA